MRTARMASKWRIYGHTVRIEKKGTSFHESWTTEKRLTRSPTRENLSPFFNAHVQNTPSIRHFDAILTPSWQVPHALLTFKRHLPVTKADILLMFCTYKVLYTKKAGGKNCRETFQDGILMATMKCSRRHPRGHQRQRCRHRVGVLG